MKVKPFVIIGPNGKNKLPSLLGNWVYSEFCHVFLLNHF